MEAGERPVLSECFQTPQPIIEYRKRGLIDIQAAAEKDGLKFYNDEKSDCFAVELPQEQFEEGTEPTTPTLFFDKQTGCIVRTERFTQRSADEYNARTIASYHYDEKGRLIEESFILQTEDQKGNTIVKTETDHMIADYSGETPKVWWDSDTRRVPMPLERYGKRYRERAEAIFAGVKDLDIKDILKLAADYETTEKPLSPELTTRLLELLTDGAPLGPVTQRDLDGLNGKQGEKLMEIVTDRAKRIIVFLQQIIERPETVKALFARTMGRTALSGKQEEEKPKE